ncbi:PDR/VanB family oxidoreductase [Nocardia sp. NPDC052001]|uniref:PDR/VanB family oxidoreductase n=1 Tax=Nocardia sp. NPDC052001 TaxID=3154853 RepID=UPI00342BE0C5
MVELIKGDTPIEFIEGVHPVFRTAVRVVDAYRSGFVGSRLDTLLSRPNQVRRNGFDQDLRIDRITGQAQDVVAVDLVAPDGSELPRWLPGAHIDVFLPSGRQRQYSLCGDPLDRSRYRIAVRLIHDGGGGSREVHERLRAGGLLRIRGPRNAFRLAAAPSYLFIAGGIGITPILPMVRSADRAGIPWRLLYLGRDRASMPFLPELEPYGSRVEVRTDDVSGLPDVTELLSHNLSGGAVYLCGPTPLLDGARRLMPGGTREELHIERFAPPPVVGGVEFPVELVRTGQTVRVGAQESVLAAVRRVLPDVAYSCQQGFCGSCKVKVLEGAVAHQDTKLVDDERADSMLICVSRSSGPLALDL